jgi:hypothetical protein
MQLRWIWSFIVCFLPISVGTSTSASVQLNDLTHNQPESSKEMAVELRRIYDQNQQVPTFFNSNAQLGLLKNKLKGRLELGEALPSLLQLAYHQLNGGYTDQAIQALNRIEGLLRQAEAFDGNLATSVRTLRAIGLLRVGEQENCLSNHTTLSCLAPIESGGVHQIQTGSRNAIKELEEVLPRTNDLRARWLLNIAYMTVGEWPGKVPPQYLVPPSAFKSDYDIKRFPDIAGTLGLDATDLAGGVIAEDLDNNGNFDLLVSGWGINSPLRLFQNKGDGTFEERGEEAGLKGLTFSLNIIQGDYDNDGFVDALLLRGAWLGTTGKYPLSLLKNNGDGTFTDVTRSAGMFRLRPTQTAAWLDYDNDGWLDLFVGNESAFGEVNPCELYRNKGNGTFAEVASVCGLDVKAFVKGVAAGDYNNDGRTDLYLSIRDHENLLFRNDGPKTGGSAGGWVFTEVSREAGVRAPVYSFPTWFFDYDNDGWLDLFVSGYNIASVGDIAADYLGVPTKGEKAKLYRNLRNGKFEDVTVSAQLDHVLHTMGCNFGDLDNDGYLDFYLATGDPDLSTLVPNRMFRNAEGKFFQDVTTSGGFGHLQKGHGVAFVDLDNDGDQDVFTVMGGAFQADGYRRVLFEKPGHGNNWIKLKLAGVKSNRSAIGARIKLVISEAGKTREIYKTVNSGGSFGANPLQQHIGLGKADRIERTEVFWPTTGKTETISGLVPNQAFRITESASGSVQIPSRKIVWQHSASPHHHHHDHHAE